MIPNGWLAGGVRIEVQTPGDSSAEASTSEFGPRSRTADQADDRSHKLRDYEPSN